MAKKQTEETGKEKSKLETVLAEMNKKFGKGVIINATDKENYGDVIPTTPFSLRNALGIGGFECR